VFRNLARWAVCLSCARCILMSAGLSLLTVVSLAKFAARHGGSLLSSSHLNDDNTWESSLSEALGAVTRTAMLETALLAALACTAQWCFTLDTGLGAAWNVLLQWFTWVFWFRQSRPAARPAARPTALAARDKCAQAAMAGKACWDQFETAHLTSFSKAASLQYQC